MANDLEVKSWQTKFCLNELKKGFAKYRNFKKIKINKLYIYTYPSWYTKKDQAFNNFMKRKWLI